MAPRASAASPARGRSRRSAPSVPWRKSPPRWAHFPAPADMSEALLVEIRFATHCHFPVVMSECNLLNIQEDIGGVRAFDLALANAAFRYYLRGDQKAGELISLQRGVDSFKSPTSVWDVDVLTFRNDTRGFIKLFNNNRGPTFE